MIVLSKEQIEENRIAAEGTLYARPHGLCARHRAEPDRCQG